MEISNFKIKNQNNEIVLINLDYPVEFNSVIDSVNFILNGSTDYEKLKSKNITVDQFKMIFDSINDKVNLKELINNKENTLNTKLVKPSLKDYDKQEEAKKINNPHKESVNITEDSYSRMLEDLKNKGYRNVYISGPIRGIGYDAAKRSFRAFAAILEKEGLNVDHTFTTMYPNNRNKEYYIKNGIVRMMQCDAVIRFNPQLLSEGAQIEKDVAEAVGTPYYVVDVACIIM